MKNLEVFNQFEELSLQEANEVQGGVAAVADCIVAAGILFVGSTALGFAIGSRIF